MTSLQFALTPRLLLEYGYGSPQDAGTTFDTSFVPHKLVSNAYTGDKTLFQVSNRGPVRTNNVGDWTLVEIPAGKGKVGERYVLLDEDGAYYYPNQDSNITVSAIDPLPPLDVQYDRVRMQVLSGYHFDDCEGSILSIYLRTATNEILRLCHLVYLKAGDRTRLKISSQPLQLADQVYDKYLEFLVPSLSNLLRDQSNGLTGAGTVLNRLTSGRGLAPGSSIYCEFQIVESVDSRDGLTYLTPGETLRFAMPGEDQYGSLIASIKPAADGDYFTYGPEFDGGSVEDYIFRLNSVPGQDFYLMHDLRLLEQVGLEFRETDSFSRVHLNDYGALGRYRPVLRYGGQATTFSLEYTARLVNRVDGRSIFKSATLTSYDVGKFGKHAARLDILGLDNPQKIYNQVLGVSPLQVRETLLTLTQSQTTVVYADRSLVKLRTSATLGVTTDGVHVLNVSPFDNYFRFELLQSQTTSAGTDEQPLSLDPYSSYFLAFPLGLDETISPKIYANTVTTASTVASELEEGELLFHLPAAESGKVRQSGGVSWYLISRASSGLETVMVAGKWSLSAP